MLLKLKLPPGLYRQGTQYQSMGRWYDASLVRWFEGTLRPMKGWATGLTGTLSGNARAAHAWKDNDGDSFASFATHSKLYAHDGTTLDEITPSGFSAGDQHTASPTLDNFGETLVCCFDSDKTMYEWTPDGGGDATAVTNAPDASAIVVTEERFLVALGADGDPRKISWADQESLTVWTPSATNQAGDLTLQSRGVAMCGLKVRGGTLILTSEDAHLMRYLGRPDVYGVERVAADCGVIGRQAKCSIDSVAVWMGRSGFWRFSGYVQPLPCEISDDVFSNLNTTYQGKCWCEHMPEFGEVWFYYPRGAATECSHAAIWNYRENHWNHTPMARLAGFPAGVFANPIRVTSAGAMMKHEYAYDYGGASRYAVSGPVEIGDGDKRLQIDEFIPDEKTQGDCEVLFDTRDTPNATETTLGPYNAADRVAVLTTARQARVTIRAESGAQDFRIGDYRVKVKARGRY